MKLNATSFGLLLIGLGLFGVAAYFLLAHFGRSALSGSDFSTGIWFGICIGAECLGVVLVVKSRSKPAA